MEPTDHQTEYRTSLIDAILEDVACGLGGKRLRAVGAVALRLPEPTDTRQASEQIDALTDRGYPALVALAGLTDADLVAHIAPVLDQPLNIPHAAANIEVEGMRAAGYVSHEERRQAIRAALGGQ